METIKDENGTEIKISRKPLNEMHSDTRILINVLESQMIRGDKEVVTYIELSKAIGRDVRLNAMGLLGTARKAIERDYHVTLETIPTIGVKKTTDYPGILDHTNQHIGRQARRNINRVVNAIADGKELNNGQALAINSRLSLLGAIALFTKRNSIKKLETKVAENMNKELPIAETLRLFEK